MTNTELSLIGTPQWLAPSITVKEGRDPLGLQTTTQDRLTPRLLPGILELSRRARYLSFHAYLLARYRELQMPATIAELSAFIKRREWEFGLAVFLCPHECGSVPVGAIALRSAMAGSDGPYPRGESVESSLGGYGLYYRSPLADLGIVARAGTPLGDAPLPIDVLYDHERAQRLAGSFAAVVAPTEYATNWVLTNDPLPKDVLVDYARVACLCQLKHHETERQAVQDVLFDDDPFTEEAAPPEAASAPEPEDDLALAAEALLNQRLELSRTESIRQRRRSIAHFLTLVQHDPKVVETETNFRQALWSAQTRNAEHADIAGQWAGLAAKDVWQDSLCSMWAEFCATGLARERDSGSLAWLDVVQLAKGLATNGTPEAVTRTTSDLLNEIADRSVRLPGLGVPIPDATQEQLRLATRSTNTAISGLLVVLELYRRVASRDDVGWLATANVRSAWQQSLMTLFARFDEHLRSNPQVDETMWWFIENYVIGVHERIAYSKLQQGEHTFRFRWEDGRFHFYDNGIGRFPLAAIRREPMSSMTHDLGFWASDDSGTAKLTQRGDAFISEVLG